MEKMTVLILPQAAADAALQRIESVSPRIDLVDARGWFDAELRSSWPAWTVHRYLRDGATPLTTLEQRDRALAAADIVLTGWPPLKDLRSRAARLKWVHALPAGASNFLDTDLWGSDVAVTTSRGLTNRRPMAEYALASFLHFTRGFHLSYLEKREGRFDHRAYNAIIARDKTVCIIGAGGIGREIGKLCAAAGMRVVGSRRDVQPGAALPAGFARIEPAAGLLELLGESDFVAVCCPWTRETHHLLNQAAFDAMRSGTTLVNVARGEIIDEEALLRALAAGKLRGVALDVYDGEFDRPPDPRLWRDPRVLITPHVSAAADVSEHGGLALFCENLARYLEGRPLKNVIDWGRGY